MSEKHSVKYYPPREEKINIISHGTGLFLSAVGLILLTVHAINDGTAIHIISFVIYGISLTILYGASTLYHSTKDSGLRYKYRIFDHVSIYILIAGTYTPFCMVTLHGSTGWIIFSITWGLALIGAILKLFYTGKYHIISTLMYVFMGWMAIFVIKSLIDNLPFAGLMWLLAGGLAYTFGAILYGIKRIEFNHAIFHMFVLVGSGTHFISIYFYVLPFH